MTLTIDLKKLRKYCEQLGHCGKNLYDWSIYLQYTASYEKCGNNLRDCKDLSNVLDFIRALIDDSKDISNKLIQSEKLIRKKYIEDIQNDKKE